MIKAFNAVQIVMMFAAIPMAIQWCFNHPTPFMRALLVFLLTLYIIQFAGVSFCVWKTMDGK